MKTILFLSHYSGFYGASRSMLALMLDLRERYGVNPVVMMPSKGELCKELDKAEVPYLVTHYYWWVNDNRGVFQYLLNKRKQLINFKRVNKIAKMLQDYSIDLVYSNSVTINMGIFLAEKLKVPHVWHFRESLTQFNLSLSLSLSLSKKLWRKNVNKKYFLISDYMFEYYKAYLPNDRMVRIYNGVANKGIKSRQNQIKNGVLEIVLVGVVCEQKGQLDAVNAIALLKERGYGNLRLNLIGTSKKEYLAEVSNIIRKNDIDNLVKIWGHRDNVNEIIKEMNLGVMSSRDEAFGRVTIEYMLHSMPVMASKSGANPELIIEGENGYLYPLADAEKLADLIEKFIKKPELLNTIGNNAYRSAKKFSIERNTDKIYAQIEKVFNKQ